MDSEKDYIDKLYSEKFEKFEFQSSTDDWNNLNTKLSKSNFLKFSFATFNVYFLIVILSFVSAVAYLAINNIYLSNKIEILENEIDVIQEQENENEIKPVITDSVIIETNENNSEINNVIKTPDSTKKNKNSQKNSNDKANIITNLPVTGSTKDSVSVTPDSLSTIIPDSSNVIKPKTQQIKRVKKTVFIKKDQVIVTDTVIVKKKAK